MEIFKIEIWNRTDKQPIDISYVIGSYKDALTYFTPWKNQPIKCCISYGKYDHDSQNHRMIFQPMFIREFGADYSPSRIMRNAVQVDIFKDE